MRVDDFDFELPTDRIALRPAVPRRSARLLSVDPNLENAVKDFHISDLPDLLRAGDVLVFNNTRVIPARLAGKRVGRGNAAPKVEVTLHRQTDTSTWLAFAKPARKLEAGDVLVFGTTDATCRAGRLEARVTEKLDAGEILLSFDFSGPVFDELLTTLGQMPLPPYIASRREPDARDMSDYQTIFARYPGAVAAPTAGLHFTEELLGELEAKRVEHVFVTLHVGAGTFLPVKTEDTENHKMHSEWGEIDEDAATRLNSVRGQGGRIVAVGTTALRLIESAVDADGVIRPFAAETDIFITPGYEFKAVDLLLTNFHLPRSTLFMLVSAFSGLDMMKGAYDYAIKAGYRFYSYGDACLLSRTKKNL